MVRNMRAVLKKASWGTRRVFGAKNRLLCVRDAFSEAFGVKNRLLRYGRDIRYRKRPPLVRGASSERRTFLI